jgi:cation diffusion facilitator family transporter
MASSGSVKVVFTAVGANLLIGISKFIVAGISGSSTMIAEGIHSLVDTFNGLLLFFGMKKAKVGPSEQHPYGKGMELYFWSFVVAMLVFVFGGAFAIYEGIHSLKAGGHKADSYLYHYIVLFIALALEGASLIYGLKTFKKANPNSTFIESIRKSKDASTIAVILEELAAVFGIVLALVGTALVELTGLVIIDAITSITIGCLLLMVSFVLASETKRLLIGEGVSIEEKKIIENILTSRPEIDRLIELRSMHFSLDEVLLTCIIDVQNDLSVGEWEEINKEIEAQLVEAIPQLKYIYLELNN